MHAMHAAFPHESHADHGVEVISFSEIISALTYAIDLTEGAVPGHALRTCILGMRIAQQVRLPQEQMQSLYYALMLKDIGCSSNAARMCQIVGGDDRILKNELKMEDSRQPHRSRMATLRVLWREVLPTSGPFRRAARIASIAFHSKANSREMIELRCERGAEIARKLGVSLTTAQAIHALDEHWDGTGYPRGQAGQAIPKLARIMAVAQHLDVFASENNTEVAIAILRQRSGTWFDPSLVGAAVQLHEYGALWTGCLSSDNEDDMRQMVLALEPYGNAGAEVMSEASTAQIDRICEAFADVVDAKSPFTYRHSIGVTEIAMSIARRLLLAEDRMQLVRRAALLHDVGKLSVPNTILDKHGTLTDEEWKLVSEHSRLTRKILMRIKSFAEIADIAGAHHERLDGSGYPDHLCDAQLSLEARIVAVADVYAAMTEARPYRVAMNHAEAVLALRKLAPTRLDVTCVEALA